MGARRLISHHPHAPVEGLVSVASLADSAREGVGDVGASHLARLVDLGDVDLDRGVVLGRDEAVGRTALARDVKVDDLALQSEKRWSVDGLEPGVSNRVTACGRAPWTLVTRVCQRYGANHNRDESSLTWSFCMVTVETGARGCEMGRIWAEGESENDVMAHTVLGQLARSRITSECALFRPRAVL